MENEVSIGFVGDFAPIGKVEKLIEGGTFENGFGEIKELFDKSDFTIPNLEAPLTTEKIGIKKTGPGLKASPKSTLLLNYLGCNVVATANNHFLDFGNQGFLDTHNNLRDAGIRTVGSGNNVREASRPLVIEQNGIKIGVINAAENEWATTMGEEPGCNPLDEVNLYRTTSELKGEVDFVVSIIHGGHEFYSLPSPDFKKKMRFLVDIGSDAIIAHHTHVISGYEIYRNAPIFYGLGNFCFDLKGKNNANWNTGMHVNLIFSKGKSLTHALKFFKQNWLSGEITLLEAEEEKAVLDRINELNNLIENDVALKDSFDKYCKERLKITLARMQPYSNRYLIALFNKGLLPNLFKTKKALLFLNLIRCESHREVLLSNLKDQI